MNKLYKYVADMMVDKMELNLMRVFYVDELAFDLFECENVDGSVTYSTYKAEQWIKENFTEIGEIYEDIEGIESVNPFAEAEKFMVWVVLWVAEDIIRNCELFEDKERICLDKGIVDAFIKYVEG